jgi:5-methylcytosine-specific restriction protein A
MPTREEFHNALMQVFCDATKGEQAKVDVNAGELHKITGGYPGPDHRMPVCCSVMRAEYSADSDFVLESPPKGDGASLTIRYALPRISTFGKRATTVIDDPTGQSRGKTCCTTCLEPIWIGAQKCTHCDSYQDWRKFLTFSSTVLALLVSLVAVTTAAVPVLMQGLRRPDSDVRISSGPISENGHIYFLATNYGTKPGVAEFATITLDTDHPKYIWLHLVRSVPNAALLPAGDTRELDYTPQFPKEDYPDAWNPSSMASDAPIKELDRKNCAVAVRTRSFEGVESDKRFPIQCASYHGALVHYWQDMHRDWLRRQLGLP